MIQQNLLEQLQLLSKIITSNKNIVLVSIIAFITLILLEVVSHLKNKKITKIIFISIYALVFGTLLILYNTEMLSFLDYLVNNIFIFFFFPNLAVYTLVIIISNIFVIRTLLGKNNKILKNISIIFFILFNVIFYLIVDNCLKNNVLVYETLSIYTNSELLTLIEVSMYLFILYLVILLISKISKNIISSMKVKVQVPVTHRVNNNLVIEQEKVTREPKISSIPELNPNTLVLNNEESSSKSSFGSKKVTVNQANTLSLNSEEVNKLKTVNIYNQYMDIEPIKKKKVEISCAEVENNNTNKDMDILFGNNNCLNNIMNDISKLKGNVNNQTQIRKIYEQITVNSKNLSLNDYNYLISALKEIRNRENI